MTPDPEADAALDVWFENTTWHNRSALFTHDQRARMRRVLDAHDAARSHVATDVMLEGARAAWNTGANVDRWLSLSDLKIIVDGALAPSPWDPVKSPGHTDLMVSPESIDAFLEANPPPEPDPNTLPMDVLLEGWRIDCIIVVPNPLDWATIDHWECRLIKLPFNYYNRKLYGIGPTPRAAMLAAIEAAKEGK